MLKSNNHLQQQLVYNNAFSKAECELIINSTAFRNPTGVPIAECDGHARSYAVKANSETQWIKERILRLIEQANAEVFHFKISQLENMQFLEYHVKGYYDWHIDIAGDESNYWTRKINALLFLSERSSYEGGQLTFTLTKHKSARQIAQEQGTLVLFPSYQPHKVEAVTTGVRYTFSAIMHGDSFR